MICEHKMNILQHLLFLLNPNYITYIICKIIQILIQYNLLVCKMDIKQGDKMFKKGKENITVGVFNWSKDYASAASNFDEACTYKIR